MPPDKPSARPWLIVGTRVVLCAAVGVAIGAALWVVGLTHEGKSIPAALRGEVEDAIGLLEGLTVLGCLVGTAVGFVYGLVTVDVRNSS